MLLHLERAHADIPLECLIDAGADGKIFEIDFDEEDFRSYSIDFSFEELATEAIKNCLELDIESDEDAFYIIYDADPNAALEIYYDFQDAELSAAEEKARQLLASYDYSTEDLITLLPYANAFILFHN